MDGYGEGRRQVAQKVLPPGTLDEGAGYGPPTRVQEICKAQIGRLIFR
jgi:hypothetical protein